MPIEAIRNLVQEDLHAMDHSINEQLQSQVSLIQELSQHIIHSGGKRMRPLLVLLSAHAYAYTGSDHIQLAAIIELIHTATLLHDDVVDASTLRRGQHTANALWGNSASVLVGDYLYSRTFQMMVKLNNLQIMQILAQATNTIAEGEVLQLLNCKNLEVTEAHYMEIIQHKTGTLFATAAQLGPLLCLRNPDEIAALAKFGMCLGIAFQIIDDAMDYSAEQNKLGKNIGDDLAEGKVTLPLIHAMRHGSATQREKIKQAIEKIHYDHLSEIQIIIESTQAIAYTHSVAQKFISLAKQQLQIIPPSIYRDALNELANFVVDRHY